ncbi:MAG TPA: TonB-dependent receptor [Chitinophagaceae bacterium]|nr:TonB-dependent receptor [Chitinophagaceae bacterium]
MRKFYASAVSLLIACSGFSQEDTLVKEIAGVIVTGQYKPQTAKNSVYQVRIISRDRIEKQGAAKLQDVLNNELNIRFTQDLATGGSDITMMGLKGQNVKILIDGLPMVGRQGASNEININQVDINSIERIEIVEGPMSVVYGADALAGVINIITRKASANKVSVSVRLHEETIGNEYGIKQGIHNPYASVSFRHNNWEVGGGIGYNYFGGWKDTATGRELVWHKKDQILGNGFIGYSKGKFSIRYRFDGLDEIITNPGNYLYPQQNTGDVLAVDQEYLSQRAMHQLQSSLFVNNRVSIQLQSSYSDYSRQVFSTTVSKNTGDVRLNTAPGAQAVIDFTGFTARGTVLYKLSDIVSFQPGIDINIDKGEGERLKEGKNSISDYAFFLTSEITPSSRINIRPGIRVIENSVYNAPPVIPSINTKFALTTNLDLRLAYAMGFRSPSLRELYFNFFDANHQLLGNPDLKAETSNSFTGSLNWEKISPKQVVYTTVLSGFYNDVENLIDYAVSASDPNIFILTNVSDSRTAGVSLNSIAKYKNWNVSVGASYTGFYNDYAEANSSLPTMQWSAEANALFGYTFSSIGLDASLFYKFTGKRPYYVINSSQEYVLTEQKGYHMTDLSFSKKAFKYFRFNAGIRNLFDVDRINSVIVGSGIHASGGTRNIATGRSFFAGLNFNWTKK